MTEIREYNGATGSVETLATVPDHESPFWLDVLDTGDTDHVVYPARVHYDKEE